MPYARISPSKWGWSLYAETGELIASADDPESFGELVLELELIDLSRFIDGYTEAALWADCMPPACLVCGGRGTIDNDTGDELVRETCELCNGDGSVGEIGGCERLELRPGARERMAVDCRSFVESNAGDLLDYCRERDRSTEDTPEEYAGHDFWLTRAGHGAGFWDRGLGELGDRLSAAATAYGSPDDHRPYDCGDGTADV